MEKQKKLGEEKGTGKGKREKGVQSKYREMGEGGKRDKRAKEVGEFEEEEEESGRGRGGVESGRGRGGVNLMETWGRAGREREREIKRERGGERWEEGERVRQE